MKYILLPTLLLIAGHVVAQDCTQEWLRQKPGSWKAGEQGAVANVTAADLQKEKALLARIHTMISTQYNPKGCQVTYSNAFGKNMAAGQTWLADPFFYTLYILRYICDAHSKNKTGYYTDYSTPTTVTVSANVLFCLNNLYAANLPADDLRGYLKLKQRPQKKDGYYFMGEEVVGDGDRENKIKEYRWLITYNDTLPFLYLSRKAYLLIQKQRLERDIKDSPGEKAFYDKYLTNISDYLKKPEAELNEPAVAMWNEEERFEHFVKEGTIGSFIAVQPNLAYYHKKLPGYSPQFFSVVYKIAHGDAVFEESIAGIKKAIDFAALRNMLGN